MNLYHYCSNKKFLSIVTNHSIWLTSLSLSNDSMEGKLVSETFARIAKADNLKCSDLERLKALISTLEQILDGLGFCLSENGDLLSQWRGYAIDASGISIGFSKEYLEKLSENIRTTGETGFTLQKVEYDLEKQELMVKPTYLEIKRLVNLGALKPRGKSSLLDSRNETEIESDDRIIAAAAAELSSTILPLFGKLFLLKTPAFREECEWRLISYYIKSDDRCLFRALNDRIIPYREFNMENYEAGSITEVILGPKNITPNYVIENILKQNGFTNVKVLRSAATYR